MTIEKKRMTLKKGKLHVKLKEDALNVLHPLLFVDYLDSLFIHNP
jgi:hypothetical protein